MAPATLNKPRTLDASRISLYNGGETLTMPRTLALIKRGARVLSNTDIDNPIVHHFDTLPSDVQKVLTATGIRTSTFFAKMADGKKFRKEVTRIDRFGYKITFTVPKVYQGEIDLGLAADLTMDNFGLKISRDNKEATLEISEKDLIAFELVRHLTWGQANESTLWIPDAKVLGGKPSEPRKFFSNIKEDATGLFARFFYDGNNGKKGLFADAMPSSCLVVLVEGRASE